MPWTIYKNSLMCSHTELPTNNKVAAFDLDGTLIITKSGKRFAKNTNDWKLFHSTEVFKTLKTLHDDGYTLVIISNQLGISKGKVDTADIQTKVNDIVEYLQLPIIVMLAVNDDHMRKPRIGAWEYLEYLIATPINMSESFYCGDAAGRANDFAATDYKFALNLGITFKTPEELFLGHPIYHVDEWEFDPRKLISVSIKQEYLSPISKEIIILVGPPASGKSSLAKWCCFEYVSISQDELGTLNKCKKACIKAINTGSSVIIDNTNRNAKIRAVWIEIARNHNIPVKCIVMQIDKPLCMHINKYRSIYGDKKIPAVAIHCYYKAFEPPTMDEGFSEISYRPFEINRDQMDAQTIKRIGSFL